MKKNVVKINENTLKQIVLESVKMVLKEWDQGDGNYYGGGLPDSYFEDEPPLDYSISKQQVEELRQMAAKIADIANNVEGDTELLFTAADAIDKYLEGNR